MCANAPVNCKVLPRVCTLVPRFMVFSTCPQTERMFNSILRYHIYYISFIVTGLCVVRVCLSMNGVQGVRNATTIELYVIYMIQNKYHLNDRI